MYNRTDPRAIHETILRDIVDVATDIKDADEIQFILGKGKSFKSVASASSNLTLVFPCVVEDSLDLSTAMMIVKAQERKCVAMLQMLFSAITITDVDNAFDYISKFHTNLKIDDDISIDSFIKTVDTFANSLDENSGISIDKDAYNIIKEDMKNISYYLPDSINETAINNYNYSRLNGGAVICNEITYGKGITHWRSFSKGGPPEGVPYTTTSTGATHPYSSPSDTTPPPAASTTPPVATNPRPRISTPTTGKGQQTQRQIVQKMDDSTQKIKNTAEFFSKQILDSDVKKANELMPTTMLVNIITKNSDGDPIQSVIVVGVKVKMYVASSADVIDRLRSKNRDGNGLNMFIRATTREISFWKDFVFALEKAKLDALASSRRGSASPIWKLLERRALKSRIRRTFRFTNDATAITSLTVSRSSVEYLKKTANMDLGNERTARQIMEALNLMSIVIVDEGLECADFIYDTGDDLYETIPFTALERESSDNTYKRVVNLMTKMR